MSRLKTETWVILILMGSKIRPSIVLAVLILAISVLSYYTINSLRTSPGGETIWVQTNNPSKSFDIAYAVAVDSSGIYIVGYDYSPRPGGDPSWRIEKRNLVNGTLMWTQANPSTSPGQARNVALDASGIYVVGISPLSGYYDYQEWRIEKRSLSNGALIWNQTTRIDAPGEGYPYAVAVDASGICIVGRIGNSTGSSLWRIEKRDLTSGAIVWFETSNPGKSSGACDVAVDSSGIYVVGYIDSSPSDYGWRIEKRNLADGALLWAQTRSPSYGSASGVAVDTSGVYVVGYDSRSTNGWRVEKRSLTDGALIWTQTSPGVPISVASDVSGVYVVGLDAPGGNVDDVEWRIEKRNKIDGTLEWVQAENIATAASSFENTDEARDIAVDGSGIYVVGFDSPGASNYEWRIEKRSKTEGGIPIAQYLLIALGWCTVASAFIVLLKSMKKRPSTVSVKLRAVKSVTCRRIIHNFKGINQEMLFRRYRIVNTNAAIDFLVGCLVIFSWLIFVPVAFIKIGIEVTPLVFIAIILGIFSSLIIIENPNPIQITMNGTLVGYRKYEAQVPITKYRTVKYEKWLPWWMP